MTNRLLCIGDNVVDLYCDEGVFYPGGNALNVAVMARRAGLAEVAYMGIIGNDAPGRHVEAAMRAEGLDTGFLRRVEGPNGLARVTHDAAGDRVFLDSNRGGIRRKLMLRMDEDDLAAIRAADWVHTSCFSYIEPELPRIKAAARGLSYDFSTLEDEADLAAVAPLVTTAFLSGSGSDLAALRHRAGRLHGLGVTTVCITRGAEGAFWSSGGREILQPSLPAEVRDTMGAGDAFIGGYLASSLQGAPPEAALYLAATIAARACTWAGAWGHPAVATGV
jgi:fructoselysine 6-kinase